MKTSTPRHFRVTSADIQAHKSSDMTWEEAEIAAFQDILHLALDGAATIDDLKPIIRGLIVRLHPCPKEFQKW